ncbi:MAG: CPBP family intramembrane metalloprotease [Planctomycetes bacterium]|nr:CPBP family intramembrane metalloprotease [Planctomycetota bacterium]
MADDSFKQRQTLETSWAVHIAALTFVMLLPTVATLLYFVVLSGSPWMKGVYFGSKVVQFAFPLVWVLAVQRQKIHLTRPDVQSIMPGLLVGILIVAVGLGAYFGYLKTSPYLQSAPELIGRKIADMGLTSPAMYITFAVFLAIPHSLLEEYYWRWFVFGQLRRVTPLGVALLLSSLGFMAHHVIVIHQFLQQDWTVTLFFSLCVAFGGCLWAWLYERYRSLYGPWLSHLLVDCGIMYIGYDLIPWK